MSEKLNQLKGTIKEGFGKLTGDSKKESEGFVEKTASKAKEFAEDAKDAVENTVEGAVDGIKNIFKKN